MIDVAAVLVIGDEVLSGRTQDTNTHTIARFLSALGIDLICRGLSRISRDDFEALERGSLIYEALYAQLESDSMPARPDGN